MIIIKVPKRQNGETEIEKNKERKGQLPLNREMMMERWRWRDRGES